jgi:UDP-glucose:(heptosyl)LPS alpha-1,3-glucosyltransferase
MKFLIALFRYFPYGGLQKDFLRVAEELLRRGHQVLCVCMEWDGPVPSGLEVRKISCSGCSNHGKAATFEKKVKAILQAGDELNRQIVLGLMEGKSAEAIAKALFLSTRAVRYRITNLVKRHGFADKSALMEALDNANGTTEI